MLRINTRPPPFFSPGCFDSELTQMPDRYIRYHLATHFSSPKRRHTGPTPRGGTSRPDRVSTFTVHGDFGRLVSSPQRGCSLGRPCTRPAAEARGARGFLGCPNWRLLLLVSIQNTATSAFCARGAAGATDAGFRCRKGQRSSPTSSQGRRQTSTDCADDNVATAEAAPWGRVG